MQRELQALPVRGEGPKGDPGTPGKSGVNSPLVYSFAGATGPDTGACSDSGSGAGWATDTFDATYVVAMQPDGSYVLTKVVKGTFVTRAGVSQPNPPTATAHRRLAAGGRRYRDVLRIDVRHCPGQLGVRRLRLVRSAVLASHHRHVGERAQNDAFVAAFFRAGVSGTLTGYSFVYDAGANGHMEQDFNGTATGNITG